MNRNMIRRTDASFTEWQRGLIFEKKRHGEWEHAPDEVTGPIRERQTELAEAVAGGPTELVRYLRSKLGLEGDEKIEAPPFPRKELTPNEYKDPPVELEEELGTAWNNELEHRAAALASSPLFWLLCHIVWIEDGRLGADGLALEEALLTTTHPRERQIRNFLRRTGGLPRVRANVSVFSDCRLARAWWRFHLADEVSRTTEGRIGRPHAHWLFHCNRPSWETLVMLSLRRITTINQPRARAAIAHHLGERVRTNGRFNQKDVEAIATALARISLRRSLDYTPLEELYGMVVGR